MRCRRASYLPVLLCLGVTATPVTAQTVADDPRVLSAIELARTWLDAQRAYEQVPAVSAAVVHDQDVLWSGSYGLADIASGRPATTDMICSICSISKLFTSLAVLQQRDAGRLRLDDSVRKHLPWFTMKPGGNDGPEITIEGLLTHAAGLPRESDYPYWSPPDFMFPTHEQIVKRIGQQQALQAAETYYQYSNLGLTLAGEVVAATSGTAYSDYVTGRILEPLGLRSTTPEMPENERGKRLATGYSALTREGRRSPLPFFKAQGIAPAAGYASTVEDLARFASWQFRVLGSGREEVLKANTLREMHRVHWVDPDFETLWGLGFAVWRDNNKTFVGHGGSCPGYRTQLLLMPEERVATVFMSNAQNLNARLWAQRLYDIVAPAVKAAAKEPGKGKALDPDMRRYVGAYSLAPWGGEAAVVPWEDGLALVELPTMDPLKELKKLKRTGDHTFRRVRRDDTLAEEVVFEIGADGRAARFKQHSNYHPRTE